MSTIPPVVEDVALPQDEADDGLRFLEAHGLIPRTPPIRSRDLLTHPKIFFLSRRLGLIPAFWWSDTLVHGSWFHSALERIRLPRGAREAEMDALFEKRASEIRGTCSAFGISDTAPFVEREEKAMKEARTWFECALEISCGPDYGCLREFIERPWIRILDSEVLLQYRDSNYPRSPLIAQADLLLYHEKQNVILVLDAKTTSHPTILYLSTVGILPQTWHYSYITHQLCQEGTLQKHYDLPPNASFGGMLHWAIQKPTIRMSQSDRDYTIVEKTISRGPRKGEVEEKKEYFGDPTHENYLQRCHDWYLAQGSYEHLKVKRETEPIVNISSTSPESTILDLDIQAEYYGLLREAYSLCTRKPWPINFPRAHNRPIDFGQLNTYAPFLLNPVSKWPSIIMQERFIFPEERELKAISND